MDICKKEFLEVCGRFRAQQEIERNIEGGLETSELWIAAIQLLGSRIGDGAVEWIDRWLFDTECGLYPDPMLDDAATDGELWEFLKRKYDKHYKK